MEERVAAVSAARAFVLNTVGEHRERGGVAGGGQRRSGVGQVPRTVARDSWPQVAAHAGRVGNGRKQLRRFARLPRLEQDDRLRLRKRWIGVVPQPEAIVLFESG